MSEKIILSFPYGLSVGKSKVQTEGNVVLYGDRIESYEKGKETVKLTLSEIKEFVYDAGVGCASVQALTDSGYITLSRGDMTCAKTFSTAVKRMNKYLADGYSEESWSSFEKVICPKCRRALPPGTQICPNCADKTGYIKRLLIIAAPFKWGILAAVILYFIIAALGLLSPYLNRILVDDFIKAETKPEMTQFRIVVLAILGTSVFVLLMTMLRGFVQILTANKLMVKLRRMIFDKIEELSLAGVTRRTTGELMNRVTNDTNQLKSFLTDDLGAFIENIVTIVAIAAMLFTFDWKLALLVLLPAPLVLICHRLMWNFLGKGYHRQWTLFARSGTILHDIFSGIRVVKAFGTERNEERRYDEAKKEEIATKTENEKKFALISPITNFLMGVGEFFLLYYVGSQIIDGTMTLGQMQQFSAYASMIYAPLRWFASFPRRLAVNMTAVVKIFDVLDEKPDVYDCEEPRETELSGNIEINNISFGYEDSRNVLNKVNLSIKQGEMIGIVGRSGVG